MHRSIGSPLHGVFTASEAHLAPYMYQKQDLLSSLWLLPSPQVSHDIPGLPNRINDFSTVAAQLTLGHLHSFYREHIRVYTGGSPRDNGSAYVHLLSRNALDRARPNYRINQLVRRRIRMPHYRQSTTSKVFFRPVENGFLTPTPKLRYCQQNLLISGANLSYTPIEFSCR